MNVVLAIIIVLALLASAYVALSWRFSYENMWGGGRGRGRGRGWGRRGWGGWGGGWGRGWGRGRGWWPYYTPDPIYLTDYGNLRPCPADPTNGRPLCLGGQNAWAEEDACRGYGRNGDAKYTWRAGPDGQKCYSFNP